MTVARTHSVALIGIDGHPVVVEASITFGVPGLHLVGLPDGVLAETRDRVRAAVLNSQLPWPDRHITIAVSPAALPKHGTRFDLAIAAALLAAAGVVPAADRGMVLLGELALDGRVRSTPGILPAVAAAADAGFTTALVPAANAAEARLVSGITVVGVDRLAAAVAHLRAEPLPDPVPFLDPTQWPNTTYRPTGGPTGRVDLADVDVPDLARRALEIAAAGGHSLWLRGPAGSGKTLLAEALPSLLPPLSTDQARQVTAIYSLAGTLGAPDDLLITRAPFQAPHHTVSRAALLGGRSRHSGITPGAVSLAHHGVLFFNDAPELPAGHLDALRGSLQRREVELHSGGLVTRLPAACQLVLASTDCPCGEPLSCRCTPYQRERYRSRLPQSLLSHVDLTVALPAATVTGLTVPGSGESTAAIADRVLRARHRATTRLAATPWTANSQLPSPHLLRHCAPTSGGLQTIRDAQASGLLTSRAVGAVLRTSWTIADLDGHDRPGTDHVREALALRLGHPGAAPDSDH